MDELAVSDLLTVAEAIGIIDATPVAPRVKTISLGDAPGLVLAEELLSDRDYPPFDKSQMDGYAVRAADAPGERATLRCVGEIAAGAEANLEIGSGETVAIMTGAPLPGGADAVVPVEFRIAGNGETVELRGPAVAGKFIARRGSDCRHGEIVLGHGQKMGPAQIAVAATVGAKRINVYERPRVGILTTGDEIVGFDQQPAAHQIRNSNGIMLVSLLNRLECDVSDHGTARDDANVIRDSIAQSLRSSDVLFIAGGMSMGEHDYVPRVLREMGVQLKITKLRIKPGKPFVFGMAPDGGKFVFGLPGNPVSAFACTLRLCRRLLARIAGSPPRDDFRPALLETSLEANGPREFYQPAIRSDDGEHVRPLKWKSSGDVFTLGQANCLLVRPADDPARAAGSRVLTLEIPS